MTKAPLPWKKTLVNLVQERKEIPLFGNSPPFHVETLSKELAKTLHIPNLSIEIGPCHQSPSPENGIPLFLSPFETPVLWSMSEEDRTALLSMAMGKEEKKLPLSAKSLKEGYFRFLLLEALEKIQKTDPYTQMTFRLGSAPFPLDEEGFSYSVKIASANSCSWGKLFLPASFRKEWVEHFFAFPPDLLSSPLASTLSIPFSLELGKVTLSQEEWGSLSIGDGLCFEPIAPLSLEGESFVTLSAYQTPLFQAKVYSQQLQILERESIHYEDPMESNAPLTNEESIVSIQSLPLQITIELGKLEMSLEKALQLGPNNLIELPFDPYKKVSLTINGKKVGTGEIVSIGEGFAIQITSLG